MTPEVRALIDELDRIRERLDAEEVPYYFMTGTRTENDDGFPIVFTSHNLSVPQLAEVARLVGNNIIKEYEEEEGEEE